MVMFYLLLIILLGTLHIWVSNVDRAKTLALKYTLVAIWLSMYLVWVLKGNLSMSLIMIESDIYSIGLTIDGLNVIFVLLTTMTLPLCVLASWTNVSKGQKEFYMILLMFEFLTLLVWIATDLFMFYLAFEAVLIPLFLMMGLFSAGAGKVRAAFLLFIYTFIGSLFILWSFITLYQLYGTSSIEMLSSFNVNDKYIWLGIFVSLAIKTPLIPFHNWILRAHVEAPVAGSMILAGLTLKIASYGILRLLLGIIPETSSYIAPLANTIAIISIIYASLAALRQTDIKCFVAYTSVAHIGVVVLGIFSMSYTGILGSIILSIAHGITSPALFYIVGGVIYDRYHSRIIKYYRGLTIYIPLTMTLLFVFSLANIGVPLTANWIGELYCLTGSFLANPYIAMIGTSTVVLSSCYTIWMYNRIAFGSLTPFILFPTDLNRREFYTLLTLLIFLVVLGCNSSIITNLVSYSIIALI